VEKVGKATIGRDLSDEKKGSQILQWGTILEAESEKAIGETIKKW